jgi:UDP-N-acetylmuramyl pentapeptide phosphotransferase/UDP-N-acetylglucosamine-1-phosphate transferase
MIYLLFTSFDGLMPYINIFRYITFRSGCAAMTALLLSMIFGPMIINKLKQIQPAGQPIRADGPKSHLVTNIYLIITLITMWQRYFYRNHSLPQLLVGLTIGLIMGYLFYWIVNTYG